MACSMELLNFLEECEKPAPTLCFDLMELVGTHVETIRKNKEYKNNMSECINTLNNIYNKTDLDGSKYNFFDYWDEWYRPHTCWLEFLEDNNEEFFVDWKNRIPLESLR